MPKSRRWRASDSASSSSTTNVAPCASGFAARAGPGSSSAMQMEIHSERLRLRRWKPEDREALAALNRDPVVMQYLSAPLSRAESDALALRIEAHFTPCVEIGLEAIRALPGPRLRDRGCAGGVGVRLLETRTRGDRLVHRPCERAFATGDGQARHAALPARGLRSPGVSRGPPAAATHALPEEVSNRGLGVRSDPTQRIGNASWILGTSEKLHSVSYPPVGGDFKLGHRRRSAV